MTTVIVERIENSQDGVFGRLNVGHLQLYTCEDDWKLNEPGESCIPSGTYTIERSFYHHGGYPCFWVKDVPGRSRILLHKGNTEENTKGCILIGMGLDYLWVHDEDDPAHPLVKKRAVVSSRQGFGLFMKEMEGVEKAELVIRWAVDPIREDV